MKNGKLRECFNPTVSVRIAPTKHRLTADGGGSVDNQCKNGHGRQLTKRKHFGTPTEDKKENTTPSIVKRRSSPRYCTVERPESKCIIDGTVPYLASQESALLNHHTVA